MEKIKALKVKLKAWNKGVFGNVVEQKKFALKKVALWDDMETQRPLSDGERLDRLGAIEDFKKWVIMEEISWRQKSREIWLKEGGRNTGFFFTRWQILIEKGTTSTGSGLVINGYLAQMK